jgi:hypothetical protein
MRFPFYLIAMTAIVCGALLVLLTVLLPAARAQEGYPDEWLYYTVGQPQRGYLLYRSHADGANTQQVTQDAVRNVSSADGGRTLYFLRYTDGNTVQRLYRFDVVSQRERLLARFDRTVQRVRVLDGADTALAQVRRGFCSGLTVFDLAQGEETGPLGVTSCDEKPAWFSTQQTVYFRGRWQGDLGIVRLQTAADTLAPQMVATSGAPLYNNAWMVYMAAGFSPDEPDAAGLADLAAVHDFELHAYYDTASIAHSGPYVAYTSANDLYLYNRTTARTTRLFDGDFDTRYLEVYFLPTPALPFDPLLPLLVAGGLVVGGVVGAGARRRPG